MQEVEVTCEVTPAVQRRLEVLLAGNNPQRVVINEDRYYDTATTEFFEKAVFVRVRTRGGSSYLQFKFDEPESDKLHIACTEREFPLLPGVALPETAHTLFGRFLGSWNSLLTWEQICESNVLEEFVFIHNTRRIYQLGDLSICLDELRDLGIFVEAERMCEEGADTQDARRSIQQFVTDIGGTPLSAGYVELFLQRHKKEIYQRGYYHHSH